MVIKHRYMEQQFDENGIPVDFIKEGSKPSLTIDWNTKHEIWYPFPGFVRAIPWEENDGPC